MDDYPAGPASPGPRRPRLSVVIPVNNGGRDLERSLRGLRDSTWTDYELVVVDDGSTDGSPVCAEWYGARVIRNPTRMGPAAARNVGALEATAPWIFFLDADVAVHPDAMARAMARIEADPGLAGLFGSYDDNPTAPGLVSRFRNLLHHYVHHAGPFVDDARPAHTFWTGCGLIRRDVFVEAGGFDPLLYRRPAIEDIELGYRITRAGHRILLARDVKATHLKRWTLPDVIRTDIFRRGVPWMLLMKRLKVVETDLNVSKSQRACVAATGLGLLGAAASVRWPGAFVLLPASLAAIVGLNLEFYRFLARRRGLLFALGSTVMHLIYYCCCGASVVIALAIWHLSRRPAGEPTPGIRRDLAETVALTSPHPARSRRRSPAR
ncbi:glycosyltransferase family 2 protein [Tundrisphaera lichenicola]|uniref:glycosyltransferase family 2 protein n=1 Tax=Tundrisphaera lichenicola TaxID=2029860 RepID=UPI003EB92CDF